MAFMIGMGRSGTTLLTNMLNSHPRLVSTPENEFILFAQRSYRDKDFGDESVVRRFLRLFDYNFHTEPSIWVPGEKIKEDIKALEEKSFTNVCKLTYLNNPFAGQKENVACVIDKNPVYSLHVRTLNRLFPSAKYIVMVRDYRDNVLSRKKFAYRPTSVFELGVSWNFYYQEILENAEFLGIPMHIVRYEDLVSQPEETLRKLCTYLEVPFDAAMLDHKAKASEMKRHLQENTSGEKFKKVMEMHGNLESDVNTNRVRAAEKELSAEEIAILDNICFDLGEKFGYVQTKPVEKTAWDLKKNYYEFKMNLYLARQKKYYNLPVKQRLPFLQRIKV